MSRYLNGCLFTLLIMDIDQLRNDLECVTRKRVLEAGQTLTDVLLRLENFAEESDLPNRLKHYLSQRSYLKALEWLDHPEMPHKE